MANEVTLNFTAEQIDVRLENAGNAILHTEQTLTEEQKAQARENLGIVTAGGAKVVDLSDYTTADGKSFSEIVESLVFLGGGSAEADLTQLLMDATTDGALILKMEVMGADIMIHGVSAFCDQFLGEPQQMGFMVMADVGDGLMTIYVLLDAFTCAGKITVTVNA